MSEKIVLVVRDGRVETIFADSEVEVISLDFDDTTLSEEEIEKMNSYIEECRESMNEVC